MGGLERSHRQLARRLARRGWPIMATSGALKTEGLRRSFRGFVADRRRVAGRSQAGARHALIGPNGAGKTTLINLLTGRAAPGRGRGDARSRSGSRGCRPTRASSGASPRTFQLNTLFAGLTVLESVALAVCERRGECGDWLRPALVAAGGGGRGATPAPVARARRRRRRRHAPAPVRQAAAARDRAGARDASRACCSSTSPPPASRRARAGSCSRPSSCLPPEMTIVLIEHDMSLVFRFAQRITVLAAGAWSPKVRPPRSPRTRACASSISETSTMSESAAPRGGHGGIRRRRRARGHHARARRGRQPGGPGTQRRRQDDALAHDDGIHPAARRQPASLRRRHQRGCRRTGGRAPASAGCRRSGGCFRR